MKRTDKIASLLEVAFECVMDAEQAVHERTEVLKHFEKSYRTIRIAQNEARGLRPKRRSRKKGE